MKYLLHRFWDTCPEVPLQVIHCRVVLTHFSLERPYRLIVHRTSAAQSWWSRLVLAAPMLGKRHAHKPARALSTAGARITGFAAHKTRQHRLAVAVQNPPTRELVTACRDYPVQKAVPATVRFSMANGNCGGVPTARTSKLSLVQPPANPAVPS